MFITSSRIGDAILSTGILNLLIENNPSSRITIACGKAASPIFKATPNVEKVIIINKKKYSLHWLYLWAKILPNFWDMVIDLRSSLISYLIFRKSKKIFKKKGSDVHQLISLSSLFDMSKPLSPRIYIDNKNKIKADKLIPKNRKIIAIGPTANWGGKQWPAENFIKFISNVSGRNGAIKNSIVALFGLPEEVHMIRPLIDYLSNIEHLNLIGKTSVLDAYACMEKCIGFVGNDSGLMHLAAASNIPTLGLFGPSPEKVYAPWGKNCSWVRTEKSFSEIISLPNYDYKSQKSHMSDLKVEVVERAFIDLLNKNDK